jgi:hypothetical protein
MTTDSTPAAQSLPAVQNRLQQLNMVDNLSFRKIAALSEFQGIPAGTLAHIAKGREPKDPHTRALLHLPTFVPAPACPDCGEVHIKPTCPRKRKPRRTTPFISDLEASFLYFLRVRELPEPVLHFRFHPVRKWAFDCAWQSLMVAVEMEGGIFSNGAHVRGAHFESDCEKYNNAQLLGWKVYRFTGDMLNDGRAEQIIYPALGILNDHGVFKSMGLEVVA